MTAAFGQLLSQEILDVPKLGTINVHASLLPRHRGSAPINWCVMMGETVTGITTMYTDIGMDTGDMLLKAETPIGENETAGELSDRLSELGAELLIRTLRELEAGTLKRIPQNPAEATYEPKLDKGDRPDRLDEDRARDRLSGARRDAVAGRVYRDGGGRDQDFQRETASQRTERRARRNVAADAKTGLVVACGDDDVELETIQMPGAKRMNAKDYLRGHDMQTAICLGKA